MCGPASRWRVRAWIARPYSVNIASRSRLVFASDGSRGSTRGAGPPPPGLPTRGGEADPPAAGSALGGAGCRAGDALRDEPVARLAGPVREEQAGLPVGEARVVPELEVEERAHERL